MLATDRKAVMGTVSNLFLAFSGFQCNPMGGDEGQKQQATRGKAIDHMFRRSLKFLHKAQTMRLASFGLISGGV
jgi:hypothetical protein